MEASSSSSSSSSLCSRDPGLPQGDGEELPEAGLRPDPDGPAEVPARHHQRQRLRQGTREEEEQHGSMGLNMQA